MIYQGNLRKMKVEPSDPVGYHLILNDQEVSLNGFIGRDIRLTWLNEIHCVNCGKKTKTSFQQGFCYTCFQDSPQTSPCIINPELCEAHLGKGRDIEWEEAHHNQPHIVYLTASDVVKVGVTRFNQQMTRWLDQGAVETMILAETPNRYLAGCIEVALKSVYTDKTNWQRMLKNERDESLDLMREKEHVASLLPMDLEGYISDDDTLFSFTYPVTNYPSKVKSISLEKEITVEGKLEGIKGQYLIFTGGRVINLRKYTGYLVEFEG